MTKNQFRSVVGASIALTLLSTIAIIAIAPALPAELDRWVVQQTEGSFGILEWFMIGVGAPYLVATIGLFYFARWSRALYSICVITLIACGLFTGPSVATALETFSRDAIGLLDGFIIGLAYFSDIRHEFEARSAGQS